MVAPPASAATGSRLDAAGPRRRTRSGQVSATARVVSGRIVRRRGTKRTNDARVVAFDTDVRSESEVGLPNVAPGRRPASGRPATLTRSFADAVVALAVGAEPQRQRAAGDAIAIVDAERDLRLDRAPSCRDRRWC